MVVSYPSAAEGSVFSFLYITPRIIFWRVGSVIPDIILQVTICTALGVVALYWNPLANHLPEDARPIDAYNVMGFLISFLLVFKTQSAYNQCWSAISHVEQLMVIYRELGMGACTTFDWEHSPEVRQSARKMLRLLVLHFHTVVEFFRRTGANQISNSGMKDKLRANVKRLAGSHEFEVLYPGETPPQPGSVSVHPCTQPTIIVVWLDLVMARCFKNGGCLSAPHAALLSNLTAQLMQHFSCMDQIDKTQFPLPYAQIVKLLVTTWIFTLPFVLERTCGKFTPVAVWLISIAVFGLDEVAEILESPFGTDPNDIDLEGLEEKLINDLELMYYGCQMRMDVVFTDENDLNLRGQDDDGEMIPPSLRVSQVRATSKMFTYSSKSRLGEDLERTSSTPLSSSSVFGISRRFSDPRIDIPRSPQVSALLDSVRAQQFNSDPDIPVRVQSGMAWGASDKKRPSSSDVNGLPVTSKVSGDTSYSTLSDLSNGEKSPRKSLESSDSKQDAHHPTIVDSSTTKTCDKNLHVHFADELEVVSGPSMPTVLESSEELKPGSWELGVPGQTHSNLA